MRCLIVSLFTWLSLTHCSAQSACDSARLSSEAAFVWRCNTVESTKTASSVCSSAMLPISVVAPLCAWAEGSLAHDRATAQTGLILSCTDISALGLTFLVKNIVRRNRPFQEYPDCIHSSELLDRYSFPSGHATGSAAFASYCSLSFPKWYVIAPCAAYWLYTCYARLNLGVHYPSDIAVGSLIGIASGWLGYHFGNEMAKRVPHLLPKELPRAPISIFPISLSLSL